MVSAILTPRARQELARAVTWIAKDNQDAAEGLNGAVLDAAQMIGRKPTIGAHRLHLAGPRYRFWSLPRYRYLLVYTDAAEPPRILRLLHTSRDLRPLLASMRDPADDVALPSQLHTFLRNYRMLACN